MQDDDRIKLAELHTSFMCFKEDWDGVKENGFSFCGVRSTELKNLKSQVAWIRNTFVGTVLILAITFSVTSALKGDSSDLKKPKVAVEKQETK